MLFLGQSPAVNYAPSNGHGEQLREYARVLGGGRGRGGGRVHPAVAQVLLQAAHEGKVDVLQRLLQVRRRCVYVCERVCA